MPSVLVVLYYIYYIPFRYYYQLNKQSTKQPNSETNCNYAGTHMQLSLFSPSVITINTHPKPTNRALELNFMYIKTITLLSV